MFELSPGVIEDLIFAMEDQEGEFLVDLATGELVPVGEAEEGEEGPRAEPPAWGSREGFSVMESFVARLRHPGARRELQDALQRGRGVFKAFKTCLAAYPEVEKAFREHKQREMGRRIRSWYDELRERAGLEKLPPEPEADEDLVRSDFEIERGGWELALPRILPLVDAAEAEAMADYPAAFAAFEAARLREVLSGGDWIGAWVDDGEGGAIAGAAAFVDEQGGQLFHRIVFLHVHEDFRRNGLGTALIESLAQGEEGESLPLLVIDAPLISPALAEPLAARGFQAWGCHVLRRL